MKPTLPTVPVGRFYLFMLLFISSYSLVLAQASQPPFSCGTDDYTQRRMATDSAYRNFVLRTTQQISDKVAAKAFDGTTDACQK